MRKVIESSNAHAEEIIIQEEILSDGSEVYDVEIHNHGGKGLTIMTHGERHARQIFKTLVDAVGVSLW